MEACLQLQCTVAGVTPTTCSLRVLRTLQFLSRLNAAPKKGLSDLRVLTAARLPTLPFLCPWGDLRPRLNISGTLQGPSPANATGGPAQVAGASKLVSTGGLMLSGVDKLSPHPSQDH